MADHAEKASTHLASALADDADKQWLHVAAAGVHAILHVADSIRHGLRDVVYEMGD